MLKIETINNAKMAAIEYKTRKECELDKLRSVLECWGDLMSEIPDLVTVVLDEHNGIGFIQLENDSDLYYTYRKFDRSNSKEVSISRLGLKRIVELCKMVERAIAELPAQLAVNETEWEL